MTKPSIQDLMTRAVDFKAENPDQGLTLFEVAVLLLMGAKAKRKPENVDDYRDAVASFRKPFTAGELASVVHRDTLGGRKSTRRQNNEAAAAAREITGREPRKSNGNSVYDPI